MVSFLWEQVGTVEGPAAALRSTVRKQPHVQRFVAAAETLPECLGWIVAHDDEGMGPSAGDGGGSGTRKVWLAGWQAGWLFRLSE